MAERPARPRRRRDMLREVAALDPCARAGGPAGASSEQMSRAAPPHEDRPHDAGAAGMRPAALLASSRWPSSAAAGVAQPDPERAAERQGALLRPQVRRGPRRPGSGSWPARGAPRPTPPPTGSPAAARTWARTSGPSRSTATSWPAVPPTAPWPRRRAPAASAWRRGSTRRGQKQHLAVLHEALSDPSKTVRYFAALQLSGAGARGGARRRARPAEDRGQEETDDDLVERAKLGLLRLDPAALSPDAGRGRPPRRRRGEARWLQVRIFEKGSAQAQGRRSTCPSALAEHRLQEPARRRQARAADEGLRRRQLLGAAQGAAGPTRSSTSRETTASASRSGSSEDERAARRRT